MSTYSLLRSKTFWTLVFTFVINGFAAISGDVPSTVVMIFNALSLVIASTFHLQTGQSTTGSN